MCKKNISVFLSVTILMGIIFSSILFPANAAAYESQLPKTPQATSVVVLDLAQDLSPQDWLGKEAYMVSVVIQGLVNRTSTAKIYFVNSPSPTNWTPWPCDQKWLDDGMIPVTKSYPTLDNNKTYPVLSYLLSNYSSYIQGKVMCPSFSSTVCDGAVMAAITACGIEDAIPVTENINTYITNEGYSFTQKADTRSFITDAAAYDWAKLNYFRSNTTRKIVGTHGVSAYGGVLFANMYDYFIANRTFVYALNTNDPDEDTRLADLLNTNNYPAGTLVLGQVLDEGANLNRINALGYNFDFSHVPNFRTPDPISGDQ